MIFSFGESQHERIEVDVLRYERSPVGDYHDDNWLTAKVRIAAGGFRGAVDASVFSVASCAFIPCLHWRRNYQRRAQCESNAGLARNGAIVPGTGMVEGR